MRLALIILALALPCAAQQTCRTKLVSHRDSTHTFKLQKGDRYLGGPTFTFDVQADGRVRNVRLKRSSGVTRLDEMVLHDVESYRFSERSGCPVVQLTSTETIHFD
jgi:TonB family protein